MRTIDIHAHLVPRSLWKAADARTEWYGFRHEPGDGLGAMVGGGMRTAFTSPKVRYTPEERLKDMDAQGVDVQVLSVHTPFFGYHLDSPVGSDHANSLQFLRFPSNQTLCPALEPHFHRQNHARNTALLPQCRK